MLCLRHTLFFFALQIQHEVTHLGAVHKLCSDECFARFRSSRNLYMSYCENCGNCTASGNYHLVQIEDSIKKFCCTECIANYKQVPHRYTNELAVLCSSCVCYSWSDSSIFTSWGICRFEFELSPDPISSVL